MAAAAAPSGKTQTASNPAGFVFSRTALAIKDPAVTVPFFEKHLGFTLVHEAAGDASTSYVMGTLEDSVIASLPSDKRSAEAAAAAASHDGTLLELVHTHGSESDDAFAVNNGNVEPHRGFGHIAVAVPDVYEFCDTLEAAGVAFQKKPNEGRMKGLAFALSPEGYWIEVIRRSAAELPGMGRRPSFAQTMLRVAETKESLDFFTKTLGMTMLRELHFGPDRGAFSLYFLASLPDGTVVPAADEEEARSWMTTRNLCVVELTHNHGTEADASFKYHNGSDPELPGFSHIAFTAATAAHVPAAELATPRDAYTVKVSARA